MEHSKKITVVVVSDDHYLILLAALVRSIEAHLHKDTTMDLWVVEDDVSKANKDKLASSVDKSITTLHWKNVHEVIPAGTKLPLDQSSWPLNIYMRLFIQNFIPADVEKVLYLDVDMIVLKDLSALFETDIRNYIIAAVTDSQVKTFDNSWGGIMNYKELRLPGDAKYFNTGLLLINLPKWRENNTTAKILEVIHDNKKFANFPDQYGLNIVLTNKWVELDPLWNHFATVDNVNPYIIHFIQRKPIYKTYSNSPVYRDRFYKYLNDTAWKNTKPIGESKRYIKKIKNVLNKLTKKV